LIWTIKSRAQAASGPKLHYIKQLLTNRMMLGVFFGQYFINTITWFFLTWFPIYLVQEKGMSILKVGLVASIPALCGFAGGVLGGVFSDYLIKRGFPSPWRVSCRSSSECCWPPPSFCVTTPITPRWWWPDGAGVLRQRVWRAGLAGDFRYAPKEIVGCAAACLTYLVTWHRNPAGYWLPGERAAFVQRGAGLRRLLGPDGDGLLPVCGRRHQTYGCRNKQRYKR
jgi:hypothetical protein